MIDETLRFKRNDAASFSQIADEIVIIAPKDSTLYHFNASAAALWCALEKTSTVSDLSAMLAEKYQGIAADYQNDVVEWLKDNHEKGLLVIQV